MTDGRAARWREHRAARREEFLDAALRAIRASGPGVPMDEIAREAGVSKPRFYRYFTDRDDLIAAVADRSLGVLAHRLAPVLADAEPTRATVHRAISAYVDLVDQDPIVARFLMGGAAGTRSRVVAVLVAAAERYLERVGRRVDGVETWAEATVAAVGAATARWLADGPSDKRRFIDQLTAFVWGAMAAVMADEGLT